MGKTKLVSNIIKAMAKAAAWIVVSHEKPDGDTIGCASALTAAGARLGKNVKWIGRDRIPTHYAFLAEGLTYTQVKSLPDGLATNGAVVVCADVSTIERAVDGLEKLPRNVDVIVIDHHADNELFGTINWIDPTASATGEMITELLSKAGWGIEPGEARSLYAAIISDNGGFKFSSTSIRSHKAAITLLKAGASPSAIARQLDQTLSAEILSLWGRAFTNTRTFSDGRIAICEISEGDFHSTGTDATATENLVNFLLRIKGVVLAALCSESGGVVRVSLRAHPPYNARVIAAEFGGGGHDLAAGCRIAGSLEDAAQALLSKMERYIETRVSAAQ